MDDRLLSSLCGDPTSYCTFKTQEDARDQSKAPYSRVSQDGHTYIHMVVPIDSHWVAVKVTISPFALKQHPNQTFFSSQLRCGPCCTNIDNLYMLQYVTDTVQKVVDSNYRPVYWKYRASQCIFDPPSNSSADHCTSVTKSRLQGYATLEFARSTSLTESLTTRNGGGDAHLGQPPVADHTTTTENYLPGHLTDIPHLPARTEAQSDVGSAADGTEYSVSLNAKLKRKRGRYKQNEVTSSDGGQVKAPGDLKAKTDAQLVQDTLATLKRGLAEVPACDTIASLTLDQLVGKSEFQIGCDIWDHAILLDRSSKTLVWAYKYIAACCWLVGSEFPSPAKTVLEAPHRSRTTIHHWRSAAEVINLIVNPMLPIWGKSAYSIFNVFADEGLQMADVGRLAKKRREEFVKGIVDGLKELEPPRSGKTLLFNPTCTIKNISNHSAKEINRAIKLSNAYPHGEEWPLKVRGMPELGSCVGRLMAPIISTVTASAVWVEGLPERRTDRSMDPELIPLTELSSDPQSDTLGTLATVAISQITPSSIEVTIPCVNPKAMFAGHETTTDQEQLFPKNLFQASSSPNVSNEVVTYMEELPLFNAEDISFQSFN